MDYINLGNTGLRVSRLCFGTLTMAPQQADLSSIEGADLLLYAFERGINFLDTAQLYENYPHIKRALSLWKGHDIIVSSKTYAYNRELAISAVEEARKSLNRDVIDIFMLHEQESIHTLRGHMEALLYLLECKQKGIIKAVGVSMHHVAAVKGVCELGSIDVIHPMLNINGLGIVDGRRSDMEKAIMQAHRAGISVVSMKPFGGGNLFRNAKSCLDYLLSLSYIDSIAIGMQSIDEIDANIEFFETGKFSEKATQRLENKTRRLAIMDWCEGCAECMQACSQNALYIENGKMNVDSSKCVLCGYCSARCKQACIKII